jgi:hypothetical protein
VIVGDAICELGSVDGKSEGGVEYGVIDEGEDVELATTKVHKGSYYP